MAITKDEGSIASKATSSFPGVFIISMIFSFSFLSMGILLIFASLSNLPKVNFLGVDLPSSYQSSESEYSKVSNSDG